MSFDSSKYKTLLGGERGSPSQRGESPQHFPSSSDTGHVSRARSGWTCTNSSRESEVSLEKVSGLSLLAAAAAALICDSCSSPSPHHHLFTISCSVNCPREPKALADHTINRVLAKNPTEEVPIENYRSAEAEIFPQEGTDCNFHIFLEQHVLTLENFSPCASL